MAMSVGPPTVEQQLRRVEKGDKLDLYLDKRTVEQIDGGQRKLVLGPNLDQEGYRGIRINEFRGYFSGTNEKENKTEVLVSPYVSDSGPAGSPVRVDLECIIDFSSSRRV